MNALSARFRTIIGPAVVVAFLFLTFDRSSAQDLPSSLANKKTGKLTAEQRKLLLKKLLPMARQIFKIELEEYQTTKGNAQALYRWSKRIMEAEYQLAETKAKKRAAVKGHRDRLKLSLPVAKARYRVGKAGQTDVLILQYYLAESEFKLMQENKK